MLQPPFGGLMRATTGAAWELIQFAATKLKAELKRKSLFAFKLFVSVVQN